MKDAHELHAARNLPIGDQKLLMTIMRSPGLTSGRATPIFGMSANRAYVPRSDPSHREAAEGLSAARMVRFLRYPARREPEGCNSFIDQPRREPRLKALENPGPVRRRTVSEAFVPEPAQFIASAGALAEAYSPQATASRTISAISGVIATLVSSSRDNSEIPFFQKQEIFISSPTASLPRPPPPPRDRPSHAPFRGGFRLVSRRLSP